MNTPSPSEGQSAQQQSLGDVQVHGDGNSLNVIQGETVTFNETKIIQISVDVIKTRQFISASPYKGLRSFEPEDRDQFFGREQFLTGLVNQLEQTNLVLLLGASGSGKSSVVRAGLIPWLSQKWGTQFVNLTLTPDQDPFESLYGSLLSCFKQSEAQLVRTGKADTLSQLVKTLKRPESFWFIFIDQFEELFTTSEAEKRDRFITSLAKLSKDRAKDRTLKIVATMRADFLDRLDPYPANSLAKATENYRPLITQMQPDELRLAIEQPAAQHGVVYEPELVETIIKDVQGQAGYLPLLQYTLNRLWETEQASLNLSQERMLHTRTYWQLGGVRGTLQRHVDAIYEALEQEGKHQATQRIFLKLVEIGGDAESGTEWKPVRRRANRAEFKDEQEKAVLAQLIDQKLLVSDRVPAAQESTVEIAHEILLTSWTMLQGWIKENRLGIALRNRLNDDVALWQAKKADSDLWSGAKLEQVLELRGDVNFNQVLGGFSPLANEFIDVSFGKRDREVRFYRRVAVGSVVASIFVVGGLMSAIFAGVKWRDSDRDNLNAQLTTADALFDRNPTSLETLRESLKAATQLQQSFWVKQDPKLQTQAMETLAQAVYAVREHNSLEGHTGYINSVSFSPDGQTISTASYDRTAKLWSVDGQELQTLKGHVDRVADISFSPDGQIIATASKDGTVILWNLEGDILQTLRGHIDTVWSVQFSPDGQTIATASNDATIKLWDHNGNCIRTISGHTGPVYMVRFSPKENILATASADRTIKLWNFKGEDLHTFEGHDGEVLSVDFSKNGQEIVSGSGDKTAILWDLNKKERIRVFRGHTDKVNDAIFSPDSQIIATGSSDNTIKLWRLDGTMQETLEKHQGIVNMISFSRDGNILVSASNDKTARLWQKNNWRTSFVGHQGPVYSVVNSPDGQRIASAGEDSTIRVWDLHGHLLTTFSGHEADVSCVRFSPDGKILVTSSNSDYTVKLWDLQGKPHQSLKDLPEIPLNVSFSPDNKTIAITSRDETVRLWNYKKNYIDILRGHNAAVWGVDFNSNGKLIASGDEDGIVKLWDQKGKSLQTWKAHNALVYDVQFSPDDQTIATASQDGFVKLWNQEGYLLHTLNGHTAEVLEVRFSPNNQMIATASKDRTVKLWNREGELITTLVGHVGSVNSLNFTADSKKLITGSDDSNLFLWNVENLSLNKLLASGCDWLQDDFRTHSDLKRERACNKVKHKLKV